MGQYVYVKFLTNIPEHLTFKFNEPRERDNPFKPGEKQYSYGVEWKGQDAYVTASPKLNQLLQTIGNLQGKQLQVLKYEDGKNKLWKILDAYGNDITPVISYTPPTPQPASDYPNTPPRQPSAQPTDKQRVWALQVVADIKSLEASVKNQEAKIKELEDEIDGLKGACIRFVDEKLEIIEEEGKQFTILRQNDHAYEFHKGVTRGIKEENARKSNEPTPTENGYLNEEGIEIRTDI